MPRHDPDRYDLSDAEKRDLIALIQAGTPLPERYRFTLFQDKREVELVSNGKSREVCTTILPFQTFEHVDELREAMDADEPPRAVAPPTPYALRRSFASAAAPRPP